MGRSNRERSHGVSHGPMRGRQERRIVAERGEGIDEVFGPICRWAGAVAQENVPGSLVTWLGLMTVPPSITPSQQGAGEPQGSQQGAGVPQGSAGAPHPCRKIPRPVLRNSIKEGRRQPLLPKQLLQPGSVARQPMAVSRQMTRVMGKPPMAMGSKDGRWTLLTISTSNRRPSRQKL